MLERGIYTQLMVHLVLECLYFDLLFVIYVILQAWGCKRGWPKLPWVFLTFWGNFGHPQEPSDSPFDDIVVILGSGSFFSTIMPMLFHHFPHMRIFVVNFDNALIVTLERE